MTVTEVVKKFSMGAGVFNREEVETLLNALLEKGVEEDMETDDGE